MAQVNDDVQKLYNNLSSDGYNLGTEDAFRSNLADPAKAEKLYNNLTSDGYSLGADFNAFYSRVKPADTATPATPAGEAAQGPAVAPEATATEQPATTETTASTQQQPAITPEERTEVLKSWYNALSTFQKDTSWRISLNDDDHYTENIVPDTYEQFAALMDDEKNAETYLKYMKSLDKYLQAKEESPLSASDKKAYNDAKSINAALTYHEKFVNLTHDQRMQLVDTIEKEGNALWRPVYAPYSAKYLGSFTQVPGTEDIYISKKGEVRRISSNLSVHEEAMYMYRQHKSEIEQMLKDNNGDVDAVIKTLWGDPETGQKGEYGTRIYDQYSPEDNPEAGKELGKALRDIFKYNVETASDFFSSKLSAAYDTFDSVLKDLRKKRDDTAAATQASTTVVYSPNGGGGSNLGAYYSAQAQANKDWDPEKNALDAGFAKIKELYPNFSEASQAYYAQQYYQKTRDKLIAEHYSDNALDYIFSHALRGTILGSIIESAVHTDTQKAIIAMADATDKNKGVITDGIAFVGSMALDGPVYTKGAQLGAKTVRGAVTTPIKTIVKKGLPFRIGLTEKALSKITERLGTGAYANLSYAGAVDMAERASDLLWATSKLSKYTGYLESLGGSVGAFVLPGELREVGSSALSGNYLFQPRKLNGPENLNAEIEQLGIPGYAQGYAPSIFDTAYETLAHESIMGLSVGASKLPFSILSYGRGAAAKTSLGAASFASEVSALTAAGYYLDRAAYEEQLLAYEQDLKMQRAEEIRNNPSNYNENGTLTPEAAAKIDAINNAKSGEYLTPGEKRLYRAQILASSLLNNIVTMGFLKHRELGNFAFSRTATESDVLMAMNRARWANGGKALTAQEEADVVRQYVNAAGHFKKIWSVSEIAENIKANYKALNAQGLAERTMQFTDTDREYLNNIAPDLLPALDAIQQRAAAMKSDSAEDVRDTKDFLVGLNQLLDNGVPRTLVSKILFKATGEHINFGLVSQTDIEEYAYDKDEWLFGITPGSGSYYTLTARSADGTVIDVQRFDTWEKAKAAEAEYQAQKDQVTLSSALMNIRYLELNANIEKWLEEDYIKAQDKSADQLTQFDKAVMTLKRGAGEMDVAQAMRIVSDTYMNTRLQSTESVLQEVASQLGVSLPELQIALEGHDMDTVGALSGEILAIAPGLYRTRTEQDMVDKFREVISDKDTLAQINNTIEEAKRGNANAGLVSQESIVTTTSGLHAILTGQADPEDPQQAADFAKLKQQAVTNAVRSQIATKIAGEHLKKLGIDASDPKTLAEIAFDETRSTGERIAARQYLAAMQTQATVYQTGDNAVATRVEAENARISNIENTSDGVNGMGEVISVVLNTPGAERGQRVYVRQGDPEVDEVVTIVDENGNAIGENGTVLKSQLDLTSIQREKTSDVETRRAAEIRTDVDTQLQSILNGTITEGTTFKNGAGEEVSVVGPETSAEGQETGKLIAIVGQEQKAFTPDELAKMREEGVTKDLEDEIAATEERIKLIEEQQQKRGELLANGTTENTTEAPAQVSTTTNEPVEIIDWPKDAEGNIQYEQLGVKDLFNILRTKREERMGEAFGNLTATDRRAYLSTMVRGSLAAAVEARNKLASTALRGKTPEEYEQDRANRDTMLRDLDAQIKLYKESLDELGRRELNDPNFTGTVDSSIAFDFRQKAPEWFDWMDAMTKKMGVKLDMRIYQKQSENDTADDYDFNGKFDMSNNTITLNMKPYGDITPDQVRKTVTDYVTTVMGHELTHRLFQQNWELMQTFVSATKSYMGSRFDAEADKLIKQYAADPSKVSVAAFEAAYGVRIDFPQTPGENASEYAIDHYKQLYSQAVAERKRVIEAAGREGLDKIAGAFDKGRSYFEEEVACNMAGQILSRLDFAKSLVAEAKKTTPAVEERIYTDEELDLPTTGLSRAAEVLDNIFGSVGKFFKKFKDTDTAVNNAEVDKDDSRLPGDKANVDEIKEDRATTIEEVEASFKTVFDEIVNGIKKDHAEELKTIEETKEEPIKDENDPNYRRAVKMAMDLEDLDITIRQAEADVRANDPEFVARDKERLANLTVQRARLQAAYDSFVKNSNIDENSVRNTTESQKNIVTLYRADNAEVIDRQRENMPVSQEWTTSVARVVAHTSITSRSPWLVELRNKAKAGDVDAARELLAHTLKDDRIQALAEAHPNATIVYVHAAEDSGRNVIPGEMAHYMSELTGLPVDESILQANRPAHTGANERGRMIRQVRFVGDVEAGKEYIIVDDQYTVGGTLRNLGDYISANGGKVVAVSTLTNSTRGPQFAQSKETAEQLARYGVTDATVRALGITNKVANLTEHEAKILLKDAKLGLWSNSEGAYRHGVVAKDINSNINKQQDGTSSRDQRKDDRSAESGLLAERGRTGSPEEGQAGSELTIEDVLEEILSGSQEVKNSIRRPRPEDFETPTQKAAIADMLSDISQERHSIRTEAAPKRRKYGYKAFKIKDGKLYPPMVKNPEGRETPLGLFLDADAGAFAGKTGTGRGQVKSAGSGTLSFRPGWHLGYLPFGKQFLKKGANEGMSQGDIVYALVEFDAGHDYSLDCDAYGVNAGGSYVHSLAGVPYIPENGYYEYRTNPDPSTDAWAISGSMRVLNILSRADEAAILARSGVKAPEVYEDKLTGADVERLNAEITANLKSSVSGEEYVRLLDSIEKAKNMTFDEMHEHTYEDENGIDGPKKFPELSELDAVRSGDDALRAFRYAQIIKVGGEDAIALRQQINDYKRAAEAEESNAVKKKLASAHLDWFRQQTGLIDDATAEQLRANGLTVSGGVPMSDSALLLKEQAGYLTPEEISDTDLLIRHSHRTKDRWAAEYAGKDPDDRELRIINLVDDWYNRAAADDLTHDLMSYADYPSGDMNRDGIGPLRKNVEYVFTFDMDTTCPRTFQYLNYADMIEQRIGRPLSQREAVILIEEMRAMGQQIPCVYCYAENKRQALKQYFLNFITARKNVISAKTNKSALKAMYGQDSNGQLSDAAQKVFDAWRSKKVELNNYNPDIEELVTDFNYARESILTLLDTWRESGKITSDMTDKKIRDLVIKQYKLTTGKKATYDDKNRAATIGNIVNEWHYDVLEHEGKTGAAANEPLHKNHDSKTHPNVWLTPGAKNALALWNEMSKYGKSASSAHNAVKYYPYTDELRKVTEKDKNYINGMGGLRMHSTNDFRIDYVGDYFQLIADMAQGKWKGHTYTKNPDFVRIFGRTGYRINMSLAGYDVNGEVLENHEEGHFWEEAKELRRLFPNAGTMFMTTSRLQLSMALNADWIDMIIPFHSSGLPKEIVSMRAWEDAQSKQNEKFYSSAKKKQLLIEAGFTIPKGANAEMIDAMFDANIKVKKIYDNTSNMKSELKAKGVKIPNGLSYDDLKQLYIDTFGHECEAQGEPVRPHFLPYDTYVAGNKIPGWSKPRASNAENTQRYLDLCREYGVTPRFEGLKCDDANGNEIDITEHPNYIKVLKETARMDTDQQAVQFNLDEPNPDLGINPATGEAYTPMDFAFAKLREFAAQGGYENLKEDPFGIVEGFIKNVIEHEKATGKQRPLDFITDEARLMWALQHTASDEAANLPDTDLMRKAPVPYHNKTKFSTRRDDPFYSPAGKAVEDIKQEKATAEQWLAMIKKAGGLKAEEDKWMGLSEWLGERQGKPVTKQELQDFIAENTLQLEEVKYDEHAPESPSDVIVPDEIRSELLDKALDATLMQYGVPYDLVEVDGHDILADAENYDEIARIYSEKTGKEYDANNPDDVASLAQECLRRMESDFDFNSMDHINDWQEDEFMRLKDEYGEVIEETRRGYQTEGLTNKREIALTVPTIEPYHGAMPEVHFDDDATQGKTIAWARFGDATDTDGNRVCVMDENQSQRHQDARKKGYNNDLDPEVIKAKKTEEEAYKYWQLLVEDYRDSAARLESVDVLRGKQDAIKDAQLRYREAVDNTIALSKNGVPDAPFRKNWQELVMKRMLRYAAENGYDKLAWTTGMQQSDRYNLNKVISNVRTEYGRYIMKLSTGLEVAFQIDKNTNTINEVESDDFAYLNGKNISEVFGKDLGEKIINIGENETVDLNSMPLGGEGMKAFYDKMIPDFMNKYCKKWGVKVEDVTLDLPNEADQVMHSVTITPEMRESVMAGQPLFSVRKKGTELGAPYSGTKGAIGDELVSVIPAGKRFVDLFSGGGAMTHAALLSGKYGSVHMNDLNPIGQRLFLDAVDGKYRDYEARPMDRETFKTIKGTPEGVIYSVGYQNRNWSEKVRPEGRINRLKRLEALAVLRDKISSTESDYRDVEIQPGDVLYADIPYEGTDNRAYGFAGDFDWEAFSDWAESLDQPVYVSSITAPRGFDMIWSGDQSGFRAGQIRQEKLFVQSKFAGRERDRIADHEDNVLSTRYSTRQEREDSTAFKNWFGNWEEKPEEASKVVDEETGRPLVVHHGTSSYGFTEFNTSVDWNLDNVGSHFGPKSVSDNFGPEDRTYNVYLNIRNPWETYDFFADNFNNAYLDALYSLEARIGTPEAEQTFYSRIKEIYPHLTKNKIKEATERGFNEVFNDDEGLEMLGAGPEEGRLFNRNRYAMVNLMKDLLKLGGYDGITYQNWYEGSGNDICWIALDPRQVKSADVTGDMANNGEFDPEDPDIRFSVRVDDKDINNGIFIDDSTKEHYLTKIFDGEKRIETRTPESWRRMQRDGISIGDTVALISDKKIQGYATLSDVKLYADKKAFDEDFSEHLVNGGHFGYDEKRGKVGLVLTDVTKLDEAIDIPKQNHPAGSIRFSQRAIVLTNRVIDPQPENPADLLGEKGKIYLEIYQDRSLVADRNLLNTLSKDYLGGVIGDASAGAYINDNGRPEPVRMLIIGDEMIDALNEYKNDLIDLRGPHPSASRDEIFTAEIAEVDKAIEYYQDFKRGINGSREGVRWSERDNKFSTRKINKNGDVEFSLKENPAVMTVFHGSAADFDKFDLSFVKTGTGDMVYGYGLYVSSSEEIGRDYAEIARNGNLKVYSFYKGKEVYDNDPHSLLCGFRDMDTDFIIDFITDLVRDPKKNLLNPTPDAVSGWKQALEIVKSGNFNPDDYELKHNKRHIYQVEIPRDTGTNYIEWEKPVPQYEMQRIGNLIVDRLLSDTESGYTEKDRKNLISDLALDSPTDWGSFYGTIETALGSDKAASEFLNSIGYTGTKTPVDFSRSDGRRYGTNYVIFNADDTKIVNHEKWSTRTPQFKNWFGDWEKEPEKASKVVDENGEPLVVYHGSPRWFTEFKPQDRHTNNINTPEGAYFFSKSRDNAQSYTYYKNDVQLDESKIGTRRVLNGDGSYSDIPDARGGIYPVYLNLRNPLVIDYKGNNWSGKKTIYEATDWRTGKDYQFDNEEERKAWTKEQEKTPGFAKSQGISWRQYEEQVDGLKETNDYVKEAMEIGKYDGVIFKNIEDYGGAPHDIHEVTDEYVVFEPTQIKSADPITYDNEGNVIPLSERFNEQKGDIRYSTRRRDGESEESFQQRRAEELAGRAIAENAEAARKTVIDEIKHALSREQVDVMSKRELTVLLNRLNNATPENLIQTVKEVQRTSREIRTRILGIELNNLLSLKTQDRNGKNMSIAKNVGNTARMILDNVRGRMYGLTFTDADQAIRDYRSQNYRLREENRRMQFRIERGDFGTEGEAYNDALQQVLDNEAQIQQNNGAIKNLENQRDQTVQRQLNIGTGNIEADIERKLQYQAECTEPGSTKHWTQEDTAELTTLEVLRSRAEVEKIDQDLREAKRQRAAATTARERRAYDDLCEDLERRRLIAVADTVDKVRNVVEGGKSALQERNAKQLEHKQELIRKMMSCIDGGNGKRRGQVEMAKRGQEGALKKWATIQLGSFEYMAHRIDINHLSHDGWFYKHFVTGDHGVLASQNNYLTAYRESMTALKDKTEDIFGMSLDKVAAKWAKETDEKKPISILLEDADGNGYRSDFVDLKSGKPQPLTKATALYLHMLWKMGDGKAKLEAMGFDEISMAEINEFIGPEAIEWADWVQEKFLPSIFKRYNAKYTEIYGTPMTEHEHYVPIKISPLEVSEQKDLSGDKGKNQTLQIKNGSMINRQANLLPIDITKNAFTIIAEHVNEAEEFVAFADVRNDLNTLFNSKAVRNQLNANVAGQYQVLYDAAEIATHANVNQTTKGIDDMYGKWAKGLIGANIAFRNTTALKQMLSVPAFFGYSLDPRYTLALAKNIGIQYGANAPATLLNMMSLGFTYKSTVDNAAKNKVRSALSGTLRWCMENMPSFYERVTKGSMGYDILEERSTADKNMITRFVDAYLNQGMSTNKLVDAVTCCIGIKTIYDYRMARAKDRLKKQDLTTEQYEQALAEEHRMALMEADIYYNGTQQSNHAAFMSPMQLDKSALSRMMSVYQNASIGFSRKAAESWQNLSKMAHMKRLYNGYVKDFEKSGMDEATAEKEAAQKLGSRIYKTFLGLAMYGIATNLIWDLGSRGLLGLFRDNDEKAETWDWANVMGYPMRGQPLFNMGKALVDTTVSAFEGNYSAKEYNPFLLYSELTSAAKDLGKTWRNEEGFSPLFAVKIISRASKLAGVNPELWANTYLGLEDMVYNGLIEDKDIDTMTDVMLLLQTPNSLRPKVAKQLFGFDTEAFQKMSNKEKQAYFEKYAHVIARAMKYVDEDSTYRKLIPGVKVLTADKKKALWGELFKEVLPEDVVRAAATSDQTLADELKKYDQLSQFENAFNAETDPAKRAQIAKAYKKQIKLEGAQDTDVTDNLIDKYFGVKKPKSEYKTYTELYLTKINAEQYKADLNIEETMKMLKEEYYDRLSDLKTEAKRTGDYTQYDSFEETFAEELFCYDEAKRMVSEMTKLKKELLDKDADEVEIMNRLDILRKQLTNKFNNSKFIKNR